MIEAPKRYQATGQPTGGARLGAIAVQGLSPGISGPLDFGIPIVRTYPNTHHDQGDRIRYLAVQHIDVKTEWIFSRYAEAQELCRIHQAFTVTLERLLASELWKVYFQDCIPKIGEDERRLTPEVVRGISFCRDQLVGDMADSLYSTQEDIRVRAQLGLIRLYLVANDCLVQYDGTHSRDTSITVRVHHDARSQTPYPFVQAAWVPDTIVFNDLDETRLPREGQEFSFIPRYQCNSAFASTRFPTDVRYCIESQYTPLSWLTWDDHLAGFKGIVPMCSATQPGGYKRSLFAPNGSLCIDVKAVIVENNGFSVHFERTVRARLTIYILPWEDFFDPSPCRGTRSSPTQHSFIIPPSVDMNSVDTPSSSRLYDDRKFILRSKHASGPIPSTVKPGTKATRLSDLARKDAHLAAKPSNISLRLEHAEKRVRLLDSLGGYDWAQMQRQRPDLQVYFAGCPGVTPLASRLDTSPQFARGPSASSNISDYALNSWAPPLRGSSHQTTPHSPRLVGRAAVQDQVVECSSKLRFPTLPPPAVRSAPSQTFDDITQTWTRIHSPQKTPTRHGHRSGSDAHQLNRTLQNRPTSRSLNDVPNAKFHRPQLPLEEDRGDPGSTDAAQDAVILVVGKNDRAKTVKSERGSRERHARSSLSNASSLKWPKENESQSSISTSGLRMASYNCYSSLHEDRDPSLDASGVQGDSFIDLPHALGSSEGDASVPMRRGPRSLHPMSDSGNHSDVHDIESEAQPLQILADLGHVLRVPTPPDSLNSMSPTASDPEAEEQKPCGCGCGQDGPTKTYTSYQTLFPGERSFFVDSWQTSATFSNAASSNTEVTVEDHHQRIDRREQAKNWHRLCESKSSDKVDKPRAAEADTNLSEDEVKAIERSLQDMTADFNSVFLNHSDELASGERDTSN